MLPPVVGAETILYLVTSPAVNGVSWEYFVKRRPISPAPQAQDLDLACCL